MAATEQPGVPTGEAAERFDAFAYVELFGHTQVAGRVTSRPYGSVVFFQIDVLKPDGSTDYTTLANASAIFRLTPVPEEWCRRWAQNTWRHTRPIPCLPEPGPADELPPELSRGERYGRDGDEED